MLPLCTYIYLDGALSLYIYIYIWAYRRICIWRRGLLLGPPPGLPPGPPPGKSSTYMYGAPSHIYVYIHIDAYIDRAPYIYIYIDPHVHIHMEYI